MRVSTIHSSAAAMVVAVVALTSACVTTTATMPRPKRDNDMARRIESAFELEKQRRAAMPQPGYAPKNPGLDSIAGLRTSLAGERQRRQQLENEVAGLRLRGVEQARSSAELASLRAELSGERGRNEALKAELEREKRAVAEGHTQAELDSVEAALARERQRRQALEIELASLAKGGPASAESPTELTRLRQEVEQERHRRLEIEKAWARLREETSVPAFSSGQVSEAEFLAVKQELVETRRALALERQIQQKASADVVPSEPTPAATNELTQENRRLRDRVATLQRERDTLKRAISELGTGSDTDPTAELAEPEAQRVPVH